MEIYIPEIIFNIHPLLPLYIISTTINIVTIGMCRCGLPNIKGILLSFIPFPIPRILVSFDKINDWVNN